MLELHIPQHCVGEARLQLVRGQWKLTPKAQRPLFRLALYREALARMLAMHGPDVVRDALAMDSCPNCVVCLKERTGHDWDEGRPILHCGAPQCQRVLRLAVWSEEEVHEQRQRDLAAQVESGRAAT